VVLAVTSAPGAANPDYSLRARLTSGDRPEQLLPQLVLWAVLLGGVVVLTLITLRLARRTDKPGGSSP
jgi:hypothetical protein